MKVNVINVVIIKILISHYENHCLFRDVFFFLLCFGDMLYVLEH